MKAHEWAPRTACGKPDWTNRPASCYLIYYCPPPNPPSPTQLHCLPLAGMGPARVCAVRPLRTVCTDLGEGSQQPRLLAS